MAGAHARAPGGRTAWRTTAAAVVVAVAALSALATARDGDSPAVSGEVGAVDGPTLQLQQYDSLRVARCSAYCWARPHDEQSACETSCLRSRYSKPGACPDSSTLSAFDVACIDACNGDQDCSATDKCCTHACGVTCQAAQGLDAAPGLPKVPSNITAFERRHGKAVVVEWSSDAQLLPLPGAPAGSRRAAESVSAADAAPSSPAKGGHVLYVLEERHHVGRHLSPQRLGAWTARHRSATPNATLRGVVRPGRWYQFRVAAVNSNGSRGFSPPSQPFRLTIGPRPPGEPLNLSVGPASAAGAAAAGGVAGNATPRWMLRWESPASDLPVQRYKVFWSRRLDGGAGGVNGGGVGSNGSNGGGAGSAVGPAHAQGSVLVHHQTVGGDVLQFSLKSLEPNSLYFLQVQAIAQYGRERLKGEKAAIFLDTGLQSISGPSS